MRYSASACLALGVWAAACTGPAEKLRVVRHSRNGLVLAIPDSMKLPEPDSMIVEQTANGFHVYPARGLFRRVAIEARVELHAGERVPGWAGTDQKSIGNRRVRYRIVKSEGGMGGPEYDFTAWEEYPGGYIRYVQLDQAEEPSTPAFELAWKIIDGTKAP